MSRSASSPPIRDPVAIALGWLIGEELGRANRDRSEDLRAASRVLGLTETEPVAVETFIRETARRAGEEPEALPLVEQAAVLVFLDARGIERRSGSEPPWKLIPLTARLRIGEKRTRLIQAIPEFTALTTASLRDNFEYPLLERLAGLIRVAALDRYEPVGDSAPPTRSAAFARAVDAVIPESDISSDAAHDGLVMIAAVARRNSHDSAWATTVVGMIDAKRPGLITAGEAEYAVRWIERVGSCDPGPHDSRPLSEQLLGELHDGVSGADDGAREGGLGVRATAVLRLTVAEIVSELGPEAIHVLAAASLTNGTGHLEQLVGPALTTTSQLALRREWDSSQRVAASGVLNRAFLRVDGAASPATLLRPIYGVIPFDDSAGQLRQLVKWANEPAGHSVVALLGPAGSGKTRLAVELCRMMSRQGWRTGMLTRHAIDPGPIAALLQWNARCVLVVDYAEDRPDQIRSILTHLHESGTPTHPVRLVLAVRRPFGTGWRSVFRGSDGDNLLDNAAELDVIDAWQHVARAHYFRAAQDAFANQLHLTIRRPRRLPAWIHNATLDRPLLLAAAAMTDLLERAGSGTSSHHDAAGVITALLSHEANYWNSAPTTRNVRAEHSLTARALIAAALALPVEDPIEAEVAARLTLSSDLADEPIVVRRQWARWILGTYPCGRLEPDLLLEQLVVEHCANTRPDDPIDWPAALDPSRSPSDLASTVTLIGRVAQHNPRFAATLSPAWSRALGPLLELVRQGPDDHAQLLTSLTSTAEAMPATLEAENVLSNLPEDERFTRIGAVLARTTVTALQAHAIRDDRMFSALLALGVYSGRLSEHAEAIAATENALEWARRNVAARTTEQRAELALTLVNLGSDLAETGEHSSSIAATQEAVSLCRALVGEHAPEATNGLAAALLNLGACLTSAKDNKAALTATSEAVGLMRETPSTEHDAEQLSLALTNLALNYLHMNEPGKAADLAAEALRLWRTLTGPVSMQYDAQLLKTLSTLATALARSHQTVGVLASRREAVLTARRLYAQDSQRWRDELARHLRLLASSVADEILTEEEAKIRTELASLLREKTRVPRSAD